LRGWFFYPQTVKFRGIISPKNQKIEEKIPRFLQKVRKKFRDFENLRIFAA